MVLGKIFGSLTSGVQVKKLKFQCPGLIVTGTPSGSVEG